MDTGRVFIDDVAWGTFTTQFDREKKSFHFAFTGAGELDFIVDAKDDRVDIMFPPEALKGRDPHGLAKSLDEALTGMLGIAGPAAVMIPYLLMPNALPSFIVPPGGLTVHPKTGLVVRFEHPDLAGFITEYEPTLEDA